LFWQFLKSGKFLQPKARWYNKRSRGYVNIRPRPSGREGQTYRAWTLLFILVGKVYQSLKIGE